MGINDCILFTRKPGVDCRTFPAF